jgi:6-phosphofructokinase 1
MAKLLIAHGGAPTAVINASLAGAVREAQKSGKADGILGAVYGTSGILNEAFLDLGGLDGVSLEALRLSPASAIGTSRTPLEQKDYEAILRALKAHDIGYVLLTGGNGTMDTCAKLWEQCRDAGIIVGGIPKTIDNDLDLTDHAPGYGSAARFAAVTMREIAADVAALPIHVCIVEYMGRNSGWVAAASALSRKKPGDAPHLILVPEVPFDEADFLEEVQKIWEKGRGVVVAVSEGIHYADGTPVAPPMYTSGRAVYFGAVSQYLSRLVIEKLGVKARCETPGILGRCCAEMVSDIDRRETEALGALAARTVLSGIGGMMAGLRRVSDAPYDCEEILIPLNRLTLHERLLPKEYLDRYDVTETFLRWCMPLIGEKLPEIVQWAGKE